MRSFIAKYNSWIQVIAILVVLYFAARSSTEAKPWEQVRSSLVAAFLAYAIVSFVATLTIEERLQSLESAIAVKDATIRTDILMMKQLLSGGKLVEIAESESFLETIRLIEQARESIVHFSVGKGRSAPETFHDKYRELVIKKVKNSAFRSFRRAGFFGDPDRQRRFITLAQSLTDELIPKLRLYDLGKDAKTILSISFLIADKRSGIVVFATSDGNRDKAFTVHDAAAEGFYSLFETAISGCDEVANVFHRSA